MKKLILTFALSSLVAAPALAKNLMCRGVVPAGNVIGGIEKIEVTASDFQGMAMKDVVAAVQLQSFNGKELSVGRGEVVMADQNLDPQTSSTHARYDLRQLKNSGRFESFAPGDRCQLSLMIPTRSANYDNFSAPLVVRCDRSSGSITLQCRLH